MDTSLLAVLEQHNPWLKQPGQQAQLLTASLPAHFVPRRQQLRLEAGVAEVVVGPRQAGKSTFIRQALSLQERPIVILNAEEPRVRELCQSPALVTAALAEVLPANGILFFEEVQHLVDAALLIKGVVDLRPGLRLVATGSASFGLRAKTRESLAGRARRTLLLPFSLAEVCQGLPDLVPAMADAERLRLWERMLVYGGYPRPWLSSEPVEPLRRLLESFVLADASDLHTIERPAVLRKLLALAAEDVGNLVNLAAWAATAGVSRTLVARYLEIAAGAFVLTLLPPFVGGKRAEVIGTPKGFYFDNGLRNALVGGFHTLPERTDRGALWENAVHAELAKQVPLLAELRFWRSKNKAEVDFVVRHHDRLCGIEVKAAALTRPQLALASRSFIAAYQPDVFVVVNAGLRQHTEEHGVPVLYRRPWELLDELGLG